MNTHKNPNNLKPTPTPPPLPEPPKPPPRLISETFSIELPKEKEPSEE